MTTESVTVTPTEVRLTLRLKRGRWLRLSETRARLDRVSKYTITRLQRRYPCLAVSRPVWSVTDAPAPFGMPNYAHCLLGYVDLAPYTDKERFLTVLPDAMRDVTIPMNREQRRAQRD